MERLIITALDSTILFSERRKHQALVETIGRNIDPSLLQGRSPQDIIPPDQREKYNQALNSPNYLFLDTPISGASEILTFFSGKGYSIAYLTRRGQELEAPTRDWLQTHKFPLNGSHLLMGTREETLKQAHRIGFPVAGVGSSLEDAQAFLGSGITPLILVQGKKRPELYPRGCILISSWEEVEEWVRNNG
jgi:hypothetical protein